MRCCDTARLVATALVVLIVTGCGAQRGIMLPDLPDWDTRTRVLGDMDDWEFKGRIGVSAGDEGFNGKLRYAQREEDFLATVSGPLGFGTVRIEGDGKQVTIIDKDGKKWVLPDPETDLQDMYGWTIPVGSLRYWALGIPNPSVQAMTEFDADGRLGSLEQSDWIVNISQYSPGGGQMMPRRLSANRGDNRVRLVIDTWTFR